MSDYINAIKQKFIEQKEAIINHKLSLVEEADDETDFAQGLIINFMLEQLSYREQEQLTKLNLALKRIDNGTFGICESCEEPISKKRLLAIPHCNTCISCAEIQERLNKQYRK